MNSKPILYTLTSLNRTFMELKQIGPRKTLIIIGVLIVPLWN